MGDSRAFANARTRLSRMGFWLFHASVAVALSIVLLLSYWWSADDGAKRGRFFVVFVVSFLMLVGFATKALIVSAALDQLFLSMARADMTCTIPVIACTSYQAESKPDKKSEWNSLFFGSSGANLDAAKNGTNNATAPNEKSKLTWESSQASEQMRRSSIKQINEMRAVAESVLSLRWYSDHYLDNRWLVADYYHERIVKVMNPINGTSI